jgi:hypothetical protein
MPKRGVWGGPEGTPPSLQLGQPVCCNRSQRFAWRAVVWGVRPPQISEADRFSAVVVAKALLLWPCTGVGDLEGPYLQEVRPLCEHGRAALCSRGAGARGTPAAGDRERTGVHQSRRSLVAGHQVWACRRRAARPRHPNSARKGATVFDSTTRGTCCSTLLGRHASRCEGGVHRSAR